MIWYWTFFKLRALLFLYLGLLCLSCILCILLSYCYIDCLTSMSFRHVWYVNILIWITHSNFSILFLSLPAFTKWQTYYWLVNISWHSFKMAFCLFLISIFDYFYPLTYPSLENTEFLCLHLYKCCLKPCVLLCLAAFPHSSV